VILKVWVKEETLMAREMKGHKAHSKKLEVIYIKRTTGNSTVTKHYKRSNLNTKFTLFYSLNVPFCLLIFSKIFIQTSPFSYTIIEKLFLNDS